MTRSIDIDFNQHVIDEFRTNGGLVGPPFEGARLLLLTTTGARSGRSHTTPVGYLPDGDRTIVIASAGGSPRHPAWFHNLVANPEVTVEDGTFTYQAEAEVLYGDERDAIFTRAVEADAGWGEYEERSGRRLPVVALTQTSGGPVAAGSWDVALRQIHDAFRRELRLVRHEVATSGPRLGAQLRVNCLTLCQGLEFHHRVEDGGMFVALADDAEAGAQLAPVLAGLRDEHASIATLLADLRRVLGEPDPDVTALRADVDRLVDDIERHLDHEEKHLLPHLARLSF